ncbi:MAG: hypothetical protein ACLQO7_03645 [Candidatus Bathyarchaeia archaeon]
MSLFDWQLFSDAESFLQTRLDGLFGKSSFVLEQANEIQRNTSTNIFDWVDHLILPAQTVNVEELVKMGFEEFTKSLDGASVFRVTGSTLFPLILKKGQDSEVALGVEDVEGFGKIARKKRSPQGEANSSFRKIVLVNENEFILSAVERRGSAGYTVEEKSDIESYLDALNALYSRKRLFSTAEEGIYETQKLLKSFETRLSKPRLADAFFRAERRYWETRNNAARVQKTRQNRVGAGWGNVDHHTFRSSRQNFSALIRLFEYLGLHLRESFHAGDQAGWGAQILEDEDGRNVVFADVDLSAEERGVDFAHRGLETRSSLGTVGLWVGLNGESILEAGMHHLAARLNFEAAREDLKSMGIGMMKPFSNFSFLKQAFTEPEKWQVQGEKLNLLLKNQSLSSEQASMFLREGVVGGHLETIQRSQGFKGFNQNSVSAIIKLTNPLVQEGKYA